MSGDTREANEKAWVVTEWNGKPGHYGSWVAQTWHLYARNRKHAKGQYEPNRRYKDTNITASCTEGK